MDPKSIVLGLILGGTTATFAGIDDAKAKILALVPGVTTHSVDLGVGDDGSITAGIRRRGVLSADAKAAGLQAPAWSINNVACAADTIAVVLAKCPVIDDVAVPEAFKK